MTHPDDGDYDAIVVDAHEGDEGALHIELALTSGARKGELVTIVGPSDGRDAVALLGLPATLRVVDGEPRLTLDG